MNKLNGGTSWLLTTIVLALPIVFWWNGQTILDWWKLRGYTPPASVVALATQDSMNGYARRIFYVNHPQLQSDVAKFRSDCQQTELTIVLGCYHSGQNGIFVFDVQNPQLSGVQQVTAAHEMLHSAYDRLSREDKAKVDKLLQNYYDSQLTDQRIKDTIDSYRTTEPNDVVNEMHSIFGTEVTSLPVALEQYYSRYFINRSAVTKLANSYEAEFTSRSDQIKADDAQLAVIKTQISDQEASLKTQRSKIDSDRNQLDSLRASNQIQQYNSKVASFNSEVNNYNYGVEQLKQTINSYNDLVAKRNAIAEELASLTKSIDTRTAPQSAQ